jgi:hypothetical protein
MVAAVIAHGDAAPVPELAEHVLDAVPLPVGHSVMPNALLAAMA